MSQQNQSARMLRRSGEPAQRGPGIDADAYLKELARLEEMLAPLVDMGQHWKPIRDRVEVKLEAIDKDLDGYESRSGEDFLVWVVGILARRKELRTIKNLPEDCAMEIRHVQEMRSEVQKQAGIRRGA